MQVSYIQFKYAPNNAVFRSKGKWWLKVPDAPYASEILNLRNPFREKSLSDIPQYFDGEVRIALVKK